MRKALTSTRWISLVAVLAAAVTLALPVRSMAGPSGPDHPRPAAIVGMVVNADEEPVAGARVVLVNADGEVVRRTLTRRRGRFFFRHVRPGQYAVRAAKRGVGEGAARVEVRPGHIARVRIMLSQ